MAGIGSQTPNWREALAAVDSISHNATYVTSTNGKLDVNASATISGSAIPISGATTAIVTAIVDGSGNQITSFGGGTQYTDGGTPPANPIGPTLIYDNGGTWKHTSVANPLPTTISGVATSANQTNGTQQTKLTDGTNIANIVAGDTGFNGVATAGATRTYTFSTTTTGASTVLANTPCEGFSWVEIVYTSVGSGLALTGQFSTASGGTYVNSSSFGSGGTSAAVSALGVTVNVIYSGPVRGNYFQIAVSALTSGTFAGTVTLRSTSVNSGGVIALQTGTWSVGSNSATGSAVPANAFFIGGQAASGNLTGARMGGSDGLNDGTVLGNIGYVYNGASADRARSATAASNTTGTGLLGAAALGFDGTNYQRITVNSTTTTSKNGADANILSILGTAPTTAGKLDVKGADGDVFVRQATASNFNAQVVGATASGASVSGNPVQVGGQAKTSLPSAVSDGQVVEATYDKFGRQVVLPNAQRDLVLPMTQLTLTATTTETSLIGAVASTFNDILSLVVINTSATATQVDFRDSTAGTIRLSLYVPAGDTRGISLTTPMPQAAVNTAWTAKCGTSVSSVIITGTYISNK